MKSMPKPVAAESASAALDAKINELGDWRGKMLAKVRAIIHKADPQVVEELKWRGTPIWSHGGIICTGETYKSVVKMTFAKGASLPDPAGLEVKRERQREGASDPLAPLSLRGGSYEQDLERVRDSPGGERGARGVERLPETAPVLFAEEGDRAQIEDQIDVFRRQPKDLEPDPPLVGDERVENPDAGALQLDRFRLESTGIRRVLHLARIAAPRQGIHQRTRAPPQVVEDLCIALASAREGRDPHVHVRFLEVIGHHERAKGKGPWVDIRRGRRREALQARAHALERSRLRRSGSLRYSHSYPVARLAWLRDLGGISRRRAGARFREGS